MNFVEFKEKYEQEPVREWPNAVTQLPVVSVCVQTYQHCDYIKKCLDGILMQQTNFPFEILLGEDNSTDETREICLGYAKRNPEKIKLFLHHRKNNIKINNCSTGRFNFIYNLFSAKGKYIALCEGDDYWTDPLKLQKQVDFLEKNEKFKICFHNVKIYLQEENKFIEDKITRNVQSTSSLEDLARGNFMHTPSVVIRNNFEIPPWFDKAALGDWTLYMSIIGNCEINKLEEEMAVYRVHRASIWSSVTRRKVLQRTIKNVELLRRKMVYSPEIDEILLDQVRRFRTELKDITPWKNRLSQFFTFK